MEAVVAHDKQIADWWIVGCNEVICDEIEARRAEVNAKSGIANADDDDVLSTCVWIINKQYG